MMKLAEVCSRFAAAYKVPFTDVQGVVGYGLEEIRARTFGLANALKQRFNIGKRLFCIAHCILV